MGFLVQNDLGSCYKIVTPGPEEKDRALDVSEAEIQCQRYNDNAHLLSIDTEDEQDFMEIQLQYEGSEFILT